MDRDRAANKKLQALKERAKQHLAAILEQQAAAGSSGNGSSSSSSRSSSTGVIDTRELRAKLENAILVMQTGLVERETEVRLLVLAAMCREHILLIGPPGTAKSEVGRRLSQLIQGSYFERLLTRFSVPEELFGPLSMRALEEDKYVRQTRGYLPDAQVAFIDEIFKANSAILNTLLTILNERLFDNGSQRLKVPLVTLVGASNELPESEELDALYDRFLLRKEVKQVSVAGLTQMLDYYAGNSYDDGDSVTPSSGGARSTTIQASSGWQCVLRAHVQLGETVDPSARLTMDDFQQTRAAALSAVRVPQHVIQLLADLRSYLQEKIEPPVYVSDRRLVKAVALMQVAAYCNGRDSVTEYDCLLLEHVLWQLPEHAPKISDWLLSQLAVDDGMKQVTYLLRGLFGRACRSLGGVTEPIEAIREECGQLRGLLAAKLVQINTNLEGGFPVVLDNLWLGREEGEAVAAALVPKLQKTQVAVEQLLFEVATLEVALEDNSDAVTLANLMPKHWADFIRNSPMDEVKPIGTTPLRI
ncbi:AAA domain-containing protein [Scenedesmus sp. NREL 46B-D3]|nr:AAA domain-containing protein [Scenedesmus sp. NREL 46B-D3]